jgi:hypothetical protein
LLPVCDRFFEIAVLDCGEVAGGAEGDGDAVRIIRE